MRIRILALRILKQLRHDRRTLALVLFAPLLVLGILYFILTGSGATYTVVAGDVPESLVESLRSDEDISVKVIAPDGRRWTSNCHVTSPEKLKTAVKKQEATAAVRVSEDLGTAIMYVDGTNSMDASKIKGAFTRAFSKELETYQKKQFDSLPFDVEIESPEIKYSYIYGKEDNTIFDTFGSALVGLIVFFFVFLIAGINFLSERTSGTLEKMLSTPIKRYEIVLGYTLGYSILAVIQTVIITLFVVYVIGMDVQGSLWLVILINILTAVCALTLGTLLSCLANSEFQMVQFIPIIVIPQLCLCGMFTLSKGWDIVGHFVPLYYSAGSLEEVIMRGNGLEAVWRNVLILAVFSLLFIVLNIVNLKKYRKW